MRIKGVGKEAKFKNIIKLAWPAIVSQAAIVMVGLIDLFFIRKMGTVAIAAVSVANLVNTTMYNFLDGIKHGTTVMVARYFGAQKKDAISKVLFISIISAIFLGIALMFVAYPLSVGCYQLIGDESIKFDGVEYLYILTLAAPFVLIFYTFTGFFRGLEDTLTPLWVTAAIGICNAILDYAFVYGKFGAPQMGVKGAAIASFLSYALGGLICLFILLRSRLTKQYVKIKATTEKIFSEYFKISLEIGAYSGFYYLAQCIFTLFFGRLGPTALAVFQITNQIFLLLYLPARGFAIAATITTGKLIGAKRNDLVNKATINNIAVTTIIVFVIAGLIYGLAPFIAHFFSPTDINVANISTTTIRLICIEQLIALFYFIPTGSLTGAEDTRFIMLEDFFAEYLVLLPIAYLLIFTLGYGIYGGYAAFFTRTVFNTIIILWRFFWNKSWIKSKVE